MRGTNAPSGLAAVPALGLAGLILAAASLLSGGVETAAQQPTDADMPQELIWVDRSGAVLGRAGAVQQAMFYPELSPDDRFIAVSARDGQPTDRDLWIHDVDTGTKTQVLAEKGNDNLPSWAPDGRRLVFTSSRTGNYNIFVKSLEPDTPEQPILSTERREFPRDWSPDGRTILFTADDARESPVRELWTIAADGSWEPKPFLRKAGVWYDAGQFSPDGRYVAYASNEEGPWEVFVASVADPSRRWKVSRPLELGWAGSGGQPRWRGDGRELFYIAGNDTVMALDVQTEGEFSHCDATRLFAVPGSRGNFPDEMPWLQKYDVTSDGQRFVFVRKVEAATR